MTHHLKRRECRECGRVLHDGERLLCVGCSVEKPPSPPDECESSGHKWFHCNPATCNGCMFCRGGLGCCVTCGGFEGSLTTNCSQMKCEMVVLDEVYAGRIDYDRRRGWIKKEKIDVRQG